MDLKKLIKESYEIARDKGWHDTEVSFADYIANIHTELSEAWQEWRNNRDLNEIYFECKYGGGRAGCKYDGLEECAKCNHAKPCGIPIELADVVIWICGVLGAYEIYQDTISGSGEWIGDEEPDSFAIFINRCHKYLDKTDDYQLKNKRFSYLFSLIVEIDTYCQINKICLEKAIEIKMAYNKTRSYRHNGKRV